MRKTRILLFSPVHIGKQGCLAAGWFVISSPKAGCSKTSWLRGRFSEITFMDKEVLLLQGTRPLDSPGSGSLCFSDELNLQSKLLGYYNILGKMTEVFLWLTPLGVQRRRTQKSPRLAIESFRRSRFQRVRSTVTGERKASRCPLFISSYLTATSLSQHGIFISFI